MSWPVVLARTRLLSIGLGIVFLVSGGQPWRPLTRAVQDLPGFGQPVFAALDGTVVRSESGRRDHRTRTSPPALAYMAAEGFIRLLGGSPQILGNHLVVEADAGVFVLSAHLRSDSLRVAVGDRVLRGQHIADCGNSGHSSEPHLHVQLMDHRHVAVAAGLPMRFDGFEVDGEERTGLPKNGDVITVGESGAVDQAPSLAPARRELEMFDEHLDARRSVKDGARHAWSARAWATRSAPVESSSIGGSARSSGSHTSNDSTGSSMRATAGSAARSSARRAFHRPLYSTSGSHLRDAAGRDG